MNGARRQVSPDRQRRDVVSPRQEEAAADTGRRATLGAFAVTLAGCRPPSGSTPPSRETERASSAHRQGALALRLVPRTLGAAVLAMVTVGPLLRPAEPWGFEAHRLVSRRATAALPAPLHALYSTNAAFVAEHSIDPDLWAGSGREGEGPNHFLDLDAFGAFPFSSIPLDEAEHLRTGGEKAGEKGRVPWRTAEAWRDLVKAFSSQNPLRILEASAVVAHYAADAHVPLHAVVNYDGKLSGQTGIHSRWETGLYARYQRQIEGRLGPVKLEGVSDPSEFVFAILRQSFPLAAEVLASDHACAGPTNYVDTPEDDRYGDDYWTAFYENEGPRIAERLTSASGAVASLWRSAWIAAGRPPVPETFRVDRVRRQTKVALVTLDGSSSVLLTNAMTRGVMPNLARLRASGAFTDSVTTTLPGQTAVAHATIYTGAWPSRHGIMGNRIYSPGQGPMDGFASTSLLAEPLWITAARQGLDVTVVAAPLVSPFATWERDRRFGGNFGRQLTLLSAYDGPTPAEGVSTERDLATSATDEWKGAPAGAREITLSGPGRPLYALAFDDPAITQQGLDSVVVASRRDFTAGVRLTATAESESPFVRLDGASPSDPGTFLRLFDLAPDGSRLLLYRLDARAIGSNRPRAATEINRLTGGSLGNGASRLYSTGALGPTLWQGGDGTAERRYLETVRLVTRQFAQLAEIGIGQTRWQLVVTYLPYPDECLDVWQGHLDPSTPGHDPALASRLRPFVDSALRLVDDYVGAVSRAVGSDTILATTSDHGQVGVSREVRINNVLRAAGLLATKGDGTIDVDRSRVIYPSTNAGYLVVPEAANTAAPREAGAPGAANKPTNASVTVPVAASETPNPAAVVPGTAESAPQRNAMPPDAAQDEDHPGAAPTELVAAERALRAVLDPATGRPVVTSVWRPGNLEAPPGIGGPRGGALYFALAPGYAPSVALGDSTVLPRVPAGSHTLSPDRTEMRVPLVVAGPGVRAGVDLGPLALVDVAPTIAALLAIEPPRDSIGTAPAVLLRPSAGRTGTLD